MSLQLIVRFAISTLPDLPIPVSTDPTPTPPFTASAAAAATPPTSINVLASTAALKAHIRAHLPAEFCARRLRLIHAGKILPNDATLRQTFRLDAYYALPPNTSRDHSGSGADAGRFKGDNVDDNDDDDDDVDDGDDSETSSTDISDEERKHGKERAKASARRGGYGAPYLHYSRDDDDGDVEQGYGAEDFGASRHSRKGKAPMRRTSSDRHGQLHPQTHQRRQRQQQQQQHQQHEPAVNIVYIHCSIGDPLSSAELDMERTEASLPLVYPPSASSHISSPPEPPPLHNVDHGHPHPTISAPSAPAGFDRLLGAGFSAEEVAELRAQFRQRQAYMHTPDTMPSAAQLRLLEERWLDDDIRWPVALGGSSRTAAANPVGGTTADGNGTADDTAAPTSLLNRRSGNGGGAGGGAGVTAAAAIVTEDASLSVLDDILWGNVLGFFWPLGAIVWLLREEGVWSLRRQTAVFTGILVNVTLSVLRFAA